jgi:CheY-like chemotaxis protein
VIIDVVILDVKMPGVDGIAILREIKKEGKDEFSSRAVGG